MILKVIYAAADIDDGPNQRYGSKQLTMARKRLERQAQKDLEKVKSIRIKPNIKNAKGKTANRKEWAQLMSFMLGCSVKERRI